MEERQAIARLKQGDISALEFLVRKHQVRAMRSAYLIVRDRSLAEDIVQTAFLRAYERIYQFNDSKAFGPWFLKSVINDSLKTIARQKHYVSLEQEFESEDATGASNLTFPASDLLEIVEYADTQRAIWDALDKLTPSQRAAVVLRYYLDFSEVDMAEKLKRPSGTIKWLLHAARKRLREILRPFRSSPSPESPPMPDKDK